MVICQLSLCISGGLSRSKMKSALILQNHWSTYIMKLLNLKLHWKLSIKHGCYYHLWALARSVARKKFLKSIVCSRIVRLNIRKEVFNYRHYTTVHLVKSKQDPLALMHRNALFLFCLCYKTYRTNLLSVNSEITSSTTNVAVKKLYSVVPGEWKTISRAAWRTVLRVCVRTCEEKYVRIIQILENQCYRQSWLQRTKFYTRKWSPLCEIYLTARVVCTPCAYTRTRICICILEFRNHVLSISMPPYCTSKNHMSILHFCLLSIVNFVLSKLPGTKLNWW